MAEALAALGLAANILQFVDLGSRIIKVAYRLWKRRAGAATNAEVHVLAVDLRASMDHVLANSRTDLREGLVNLIGECSRLTEELLAVLDGLKIDPDKTLLMESVKKSILLHRQAKPIQELDDRITKIRSHVCAFLSLGFMEEVLDSVTSFRTSNEVLLKSMAADLSKLAATVKEKKHLLDDDDGTDISELTTHVKGSESQQGGDCTIDDVVVSKSDHAQFAALVRDVHEKLIKQKSFNRVLKTLHFGEIKDRISDVHMAHDGTLEWIFDKNSKLNFIEWLESEDSKGVYWIFGNAGSGKSTLMKYISNHPETTKLLRQWSRPETLIIATHFFWSSGVRLQKSQNGLFMTLLFQVFTQVVDLIPIICPGRWKTSVGNLDAWTLRELFDSFRALASIDTSKHNIPPFRICLFIDGLDEYYGDPRELTSILQELSHTQIKICVSSRPWVEFRDAFDQSPWKLALHELTRRDIEKYAQDRLRRRQSHHEWVEVHRDGTIASLARQICNRAQGVFLWVYLVVRSLRRGLANGDSINDLRRRLDELPTDLEDYFRLMLDRIDTVYRQRTARLFKCLLYSESDLPVIAFQYFDLEESDPDFATSDWMEPLTDVQIRGLSKAKQYQITAQCKDLITISDDKNELELFRYRVSFLHRTVSDFFRTQTLVEDLDTRAGLGFDPRMSLSKVFLALLRSMPREWITKAILPIARVRGLMVGILSYAQDLETIHNLSQPLLLDGLQLEMRSLVRQSDWPDLVPGTDCESIFDISIRCGCLLHYVKYLASRSNIDQARLVQQVLKPRLRISLGEPVAVQNEAGIDTTALAIILENGVSPNLPSTRDPRATVWSEFLYFMPSPPRKGAYEACKLMISAGANRYTARPSDGQSQDLAITLKAKFVPKQSMVLLSLFQPTTLETIPTPPAKVETIPTPPAKVETIPTPPAKVELPRKQWFQRLIPSSRGSQFYKTRH